MLRTAHALPPTPATAPATQTADDLGAKLARAIAMRREREALDLIRDGADVNHKDRSECSPLYLTTFSQELLDVAKVLVARGADVNHPRTGGFTPLHNACGWENPAAVEFLLASGADTSARDMDGFTPLHIAAVTAGRDNTEACRVLLRHGVEVNAKDAAGRTPLDWARSNGLQAMVDLLIAHGGKSGTDL